jgi:hypothetical protein
MIGGSGGSRSILLPDCFKDGGRMNIHDDHLYHRAALIHVPEHEQFTAINALKIAGAVVHVAYRINDDIAVYLKYASKPTMPFKEYPFTFTKHHLDELAKISSANPKTLLGLVCVKDREICCISYGQLKELEALRVKAKGEPEDIYVVLVTLPKGKNFRVYVNAPGKKKTRLGKEIKVPRNAFPNLVFA